MDIQVWRSQIQPLKPKIMNNSESCQPNEWNHSDLADSPKENVKALKAWTKREVGPRPVKLTRAELARTREDETFNRWLTMSASREADLARTPEYGTAKLAFSSH